MVFCKAVTHSGLRTNIQARTLEELDEEFGISDIINEEMRKPSQKEQQQVCILQENKLHYSTDFMMTDFRDYK